MVQGYCFDIESDNFYLQSKKIWVICLKSLDGTRELDIFPFRESKQESYEKFMEWHNSFGDEPMVVSFNGIGFDHWMLWKHLGISFHIGKKGKDWLDMKPCRIVDLFILSQFIEPDRPRHSLASYGEELGNAKIDFNDFSSYSEDMLTYCRQDVNVTVDVYKNLAGKLHRMYKYFYGSEYNGQHKEPFKAIQKDYYLYAAQAFTGIKFDKVAAEKLVQEIDIEMVELEEEVLPQLPPRKLKEGEKKFYSMPAKPFKKSGELSSSMLSWIEKHQAELVEGSVKAYGKIYEIIANQLLDIELPMEIKDGDDIKDWLISRGWEPTFWNFKRDPETNKPMRDTKGEVITTTPKLQEMGKICPNLLKIDGELPKKIVKFLSLRNRKSVVSGWLEHWRLQFDGRLPAEITGYTPTFRVKHSCIVNLPKASPEVLKGYEVRSLFVSDDAMKYVSADAAALENRTVANYTYEFDNGAFADLVLNGDSHSYNAKIFFPEQTKDFDPSSADFNKDDQKFKPYRNKAKTGAYSLAYGSSVKKFTKSLGLSEADGQKAYEGYWEANKGLKLFKESVEKEWQVRGAKKYIKAKDGKILTARSKHLLVNLSGQSLGATVITYAACLLDNKLGWMNIDELGRPYYEYKGCTVQRLAAFHDQIDMQTDPEVANEIGQAIVDAIKKAGVLLGMQVALDGEFKVGNNAAEIH
jgi:hypothetical protein